MIRDSDPAIYDDYLAHQTNVDSIIQILDAAIPTVEEFTGVILPKPVRAYICKDEGLSAWAGGGDVGYSMGCFKSATGMFWVKGVVIGEYVNNTTGHVSSDWPRDWWANGVWYFPGFVAIETAEVAVDSAFAAKWEERERYKTYPAYNLFQSLLKEFGWSYYQDLFSMVMADTMKWNRIGNNPSKIKTDYIIAYFSLIAGRNMGQTFQDSSVDDADAAEIQEIMWVRNRLVWATAQGLDVEEVWSAYRNGDWQRAKQLLDDMGVGVLTDHVLKWKTGTEAQPVTMTLYSLQGQKLYTGVIKEVKTIIPISVYGCQTVFVTYGYRNGRKTTKKVLVMP
jgi:hypothetical protein